MKSVYSKIALMLIILMLLFSVTSNVFAWSEIVTDGSDFINTGKSNDGVINNKDAMNTNLQDLSGFLYNILLTAGIVIAVIVAIILGIQFMMSGAEGQAKVKEMLVPFIVGCIVIFGGFAIWKIMLVVGQQIESASIKNENSIVCAVLDDEIVDTKC